MEAEESGLEPGAEPFSLPATELEMEDWECTERELRTVTVTTEEEAEEEEVEVEETPAPSEEGD